MTSLIYSRKFRTSIKNRMESIVISWDVSWDTMEDHGGFLNLRGTTVVKKIQLLDWDFPYDSNHPASELGVPP